MWPIKLRHSPKDRKQRRFARCPNRAGVTLNLEAIDDRFYGWVVVTRFVPSEDSSWVSHALILTTDGRQSNAPNLLRTDTPQ